MSDALRAYLRDLDLGALDDHLALGGDFPGETAPALKSLLALTDRGTYLVGATDDAVHAHLDLGSETGLVYRRALLGDTLEIAGASLSVPTGQAQRVLDALATARIIGTSPPPDSLTSARSSYCESMRTAERTWVSMWLEPQERLLAWLHTDEERAVTSEIMGDTSAPLRYVLTDHRHALVGLSPVGDLVVETLPWSALAVERSVVRGGVVTAPATWKTTRSNVGSYQALHAVPGMPGPDATREVARLLWRQDKRTTDDERRAHVLLSTQRADPLSGLALEWIVDAPADGPSGLSEAAAAALAALQPQPRAAEVLAHWASDWAFDGAHQRTMIDNLRAIDTAHAALVQELHIRLHGALPSDEQDTQSDHRLAEHLLEVGALPQAAAVLGTTLERLPNAEVYELVAPQREDLQTDTEDEQAAFRGRLARVTTLELMVTATTGTDRTASLRELAALQPLNPQRFSDLAEHLGGQPEPTDVDLGARAMQVARLLSEPDAFLQEQGPPVPHVRGLEAQHIEETLRHREARDGGVMGKLQTMLAKVSAPDGSAVKAYCERVQYKAHVDLESAVTAATVVLGVPAMLAYVSRGEKSIGMRAYEDDLPFLVVGGDHLDKTADAYLPPAALHFAVGAELAHLRLAHSRVTPAEVWAGGLELGVEGLGVMFAATPLLKKVYSTTLGKIVSTVGGPIVDRVRGNLKTNKKQLRGSLSHDNSELVAAHRVMQFTADRAGLLLAASPTAAIRAMFAAHPSSLAKWALVRRHPLHDVLVRGDDASERDQMLAVRVAAMLAFFVSSDFATLRQAIRVEDPVLER